MRRFSDLDQGQQLVIYRKVFALRNEGLGYKRTIKRILKENQLRLASSTLSYWFNNEVKMVGGENRFEAKPSKELSYILGVMFGDGCVSLNKSKCDYQVRLETIDKEFAEKFANSISSLLGKEKNYPVWRTKRGMYCAQIRCKKMYYFIKSIKEDFEIVKPFVEKYPTEFIRGLADSEGCPAISAGKNFKVGVIVAVSTNQELLRYTKEILSSFEIKSNLNLSHKRGITDSVINGRPITRTKDLYSLAVCKSIDVREFCEIIGFSIIRKQQKLKDAIKIFTKFGRVLGVQKWKKMYVKKGKRWVRSKAGLSLLLDQSRPERESDPPHSLDRAVS